MRELADSYAATCTANTRIIVAIDWDEQHRDYHAEMGRTAFSPWEIRQSAIGAPGMVGALNDTATWIASWPDGPFAIGFQGDDHRPRTKGWDAAYLDALHDLGTGIVYGDDLLQRQNLPTQCAMTADIVRALGYMAPPNLTHLYVDNFWLSLGRSAECIRYLPDVVVEHCHPVARKANWDAGYARVNSSDMYAKDEAAFRDYWADGFRSDVAKVRALRSSVPASN